MGVLTYAGKTFEVHIDNGIVFHNTYDTDGTKLHWEGTAGAMRGMSEDVNLYTAEITPGVFLVGWTEKSGMTVTHAMNLNDNTIHAFWTYETPEGRLAELHTGVIEEI